MDGSEVYSKACQVGHAQQDVAWRGLRVRHDVATNALHWCVGAKTQFDVADTARRLFCEVGHLESDGLLLVLDLVLHLVGEIGADEVARRAGVVETAEDAAGLVTCRYVESLAWAVVDDLAFLDERRSGDHVDIEEMAGSLVV